MKKWITAAVLVVSIVCFTGIAFATVSSIYQPLDFPVKITKAGSYQLQSNLVVPNENSTAILVQADNVTIDLNGFSILGPTVCTGVGPTLVCTPTGSGTGIKSVNPAQKTNLKVTNGTIRGMGYRGISASSGVIENVHATENGSHGISVFFSGTVSNCTADYNHGSGIDMGADAIVSGNRANSNYDAGIHLGLGTVTGNSVQSNGGNGIDGSGTVTGNTISYSGLNGIEIHRGTVTGNTAFNNSGYGLNLDSTVGYFNNVLSYSGTGDISGGVNLGSNLCAGVLCP